MRTTEQVGQEQRGHWEGHECIHGNIRRCREIQETRILEDGGQGIGYVRQLFCTALAKQSLYTHFSWLLFSSCIVLSLSVSFSQRFLSQLLLLDSESMLLLPSGPPLRPSRAHAVWVALWHRTLASRKWASSGEWSWKAIGLGCKLWRGTKERALK
uniref:Uncharacterized protein n=1 Tax=Gopherus agassizii TaxID=38772 RepID=A0A452GVJ5_9SAUR